MQGVICNSIIISKKQAILNSRSSPAHKKSRLDSEAGKGWILEQVNRIVKMQPGLPSFQLVIEIKSPTMRTLVLLLYSDRQMSMTLCAKVFPNIRSTSSDIRMRTSGSHGTT